MGQSCNQRGQANLTTILGLIGFVVAGVWVWKNLHYDTQDYIVEEVIPRLFLVVVIGVIVGLIVKKIKRRRNFKLKRDKMIARFQKETGWEKRRDLAFALVELNGFQPKGIEAIIPEMVPLFRQTYKTAIGDKQHRVRGMAVSYLGAIQDTSSVPVLLNALEDDHAHVRSCAALALGRMRIAEAKEKLAWMMKEDWDQTVRSRAREAFERLT